MSPEDKKAKKREQARERQKRFYARQAELGMKKISFWLTPSEHERLKRELDAALNGGASV